MAKSIYSVGLLVEKDFNEIIGYSFKETVDVVSSETYLEYQFYDQNYVRTLRKTDEFKLSNFVDPSNPNVSHGFTSDPELVPALKQFLIQNRIMSIQNEYATKVAAVNDFRRYKTSFGPNDVVDRHTFFEDLICKLVYAKNEIKQYLAQYPDSEKDILINAGISLYKDKAYPYAEALWITGENEDGSYELTDYTHTTWGEMFPSEINKMTVSDQVDFPYSNYKLQGDFDILEKAKELQEALEPQMDGYLLDAQSEMNRLLKIALSLEATI